MESTLGILLTSAVGIGFIHTLLGIDHSLPFVVLGRAQGWSLRKVLAITGLCGIGHVLSSVILGLAGVGLGVAVSRLQWIEMSRGNVAAWSLILFGLIYASWSFSRGRRRGRHVHAHAGGLVHVHEHDHGSHRHAGPDPAALTAWSLFVIFVLGPCEPLIPLLMLPAAALGKTGVLLVTLAFGVTTIATMLAVVTVGFYGLKMPVFRRLEPHVQTLAGLAIAGSGAAIKLFGI